MALVEGEVSFANFNGQKALNRDKRPVKSTYVHNHSAPRRSRSITVEVEGSSFLACIFCLLILHLLSLNTRFCRARAVGCRQRSSRVQNIKGNLSNHDH